MIKSMHFSGVTLLLLWLPLASLAAISPHDVVPPKPVPNAPIMINSLTRESVMKDKAVCTQPIPVTLRREVTCSFMQTTSLNLYYEEQGRGQPVILLPANGFDCHIWNDQFDVLAQYYRVIRFDGRHQGLTRCSVDSFCPLADLCCLIEHLGIDRTILVGVSEAAGMAVDFALMRPEKVAGLILISPAVNPRRNPGDAARRHGAVTAPWAQIKVPLLIITGEFYDPGIQAFKERLAQEAYDWRSVVIANASRWVHLEKSAEVNRVLLDYLTQIIPWRLMPRGNATEMLVSR